MQKDEGNPSSQPGHPGQSGEGIVSQGRAGKGQTATQAEQGNQGEVSVDAVKLDCEGSKKVSVQAKTFPGAGQEWGRRSPAQIFMNKAHFGTVSQRTDGEWDILF